MNERNGCQSQCSTYSITESKSCYKDGFCAKQPACKGRIFDCQFNFADAKVCMSEDSDKKIRLGGVHEDPDSFWGPRDLQQQDQGGPLVALGLLALLPLPLQVRRSMTTVTDTGPCHRLSTPPTSTVTGLRFIKRAG